MFGRSLLPSLRRLSDIPVRRDIEYPVYGIQREMNRVFDDFFRGFDVSSVNEGPVGPYVPSLDVTEDDKALTVKVDLPGLDEKDIDIQLTDGCLTIKGEKKEEKEEKSKDYYHLERTYGAFHREVSLPEGIDSGKAEAKFTKGVLEISLPKTEEVKAKGKKIEIKSA
ncbi:MAG: Spore protein SP21 [Syntrophus sp. SKADARSKE-3]|nr:Spore protein SP21 [Syntrophus sp. SKADARSKE-3]